MGLIEFFFTLSQGNETGVWNDSDPWNDDEQWVE